MTNSEKAAVIAKVTGAVEVTVTESTAPPPDNKVWWNVYDADTLAFICQVKDDAENPYYYDPRIDGSGEVIWQQAATPI